MTAGLEELDETLVSLDEFTALWAAHEQAGARLALAAARFEMTGVFGLSGHLSMRSWMTDRCRMSETDASVLLRRGRFLTKFRPVADAATDGTLSAGHVQALQASVRRNTEVVFHECADEQVAAIAPLSVKDAEDICVLWRQKAEAIVKQPEPSVPERKLSCARASDGALVGTFVFDEALAVQFEKALETAITWEGPDDKRTVSVRQADALFDVFAFFNANHNKAGTPRNRAHVEMTVDADQLRNRGNCCATTTDGHPLPGSTSDALLCDSIIQRFVMNGSVPIDIGRASRTVPNHLFRAVVQRDGHCRHPGCARKASWCEAHHIVFWRHGGRTAIDNLVLLCSRHHHLIHRPGWQLKLLPDGVVEVTDPNGRVTTSRPRPRVTERLKHIRLQT